MARFYLRRVALSSRCNKENGAERQSTHCQLIYKYITRDIASYEYFLHLLTRASSFVRSYSSDGNVQNGLRYVGVSQWL